MTYSPDTPVLVAIMNSPADWVRIQTEGWYRIPLRRAPHRMSATLLAWYHTRAFEAERWSIQWYAPIQRARMVKRITLIPEEPDHPRANEYYWRLDLGTLEKLARPIRAQRIRRITFIPTRWEGLVHAQDVSELWMGERAIDELCQNLVEQGYNISERRLREGNQAKPSLQFDRIHDGIQITWSSSGIRFSQYDLVWKQQECIERLKYHYQRQI